MRKFFVSCALAVFSFSASFATDDMFDHLSVGITTGTPGLIGVDAAMPCTPYFQVRAGVAFMPKFKFNTEVDLEESAVNVYNQRREEINVELKRLYENGTLSEYTPVTEAVQSNYDVEAKFGFVNGKILVDYFPFKSEGFPFFVTAGAYIGTNEVVSIKNKTSLNIINQANNAIRNYNNNAANVRAYSHIDEISAELGEYNDLRPDHNGDMEFDVKVNTVKPYLGVGFGRIIPNESRIGFCCELGCMFWNSPKVKFVGGNAAGDTSYEIESDKAGSDDVGDAIDIVSKISVFPVLNFRVCYKIF